MNAAQPATVQPTSPRPAQRVASSPTDPDYPTVSLRELKSLDAIHLASALELAGAGEPVTMLTHDARLAQAAAAHGLEVIDPEAWAPCR